MCNNVYLPSLNTLFKIYSLIITKLICYLISQLLLILMAKLKKIVIIVILQYNSSLPSSTEFCHQNKFKQLVKGRIRISAFVRPVMLD